MNIVFLFLAVLLCCSMPMGVSAQLSTCTSGQVSLQTLVSTTYVVGTNTYTIGFCSATQPSSGTLTPCTTSGYVTIHDLTSGACTTSMNVVRSGLSIINATTSRYTVADSTGNTRATVTMICDWYSTDPTAATLLTPIDISTVGSVTTTSLVLTSRAACPSSTYFCSSAANISCTDPTLSCINGVCIDTACTTVSMAQAPTIVQPSDFVSLVSVADCHGTTLPNLTRSYFTITMAGRNVDDASFLGEASLVFEPVSSSTSVATAVPQITTILIDQSNSVVQYYEDRLKEAAKEMARTIMTANPNHYVAIVIFDGSAEGIVLSTHTTNQNTTLAALDQLPLATPDRQSTNLYGAIASAIRDAYRMKFSFSDYNVSDVFASLVIFTDGFDTSNRVERATTISQATALGDDVTILSIGIANTSDVLLLSTISNGYAAFADGVDDIASAFASVTEKIISISQNYYNIMFCMPMRGSNVPVVIGLNQTVFPNAPTLNYSVDASRFSSGCNTTTLRSHTIAVPNITITQSAGLNASSFLTSSVPPQGAYFFHWGFNAPETTQQIISIAPKPTDVYYLMESYSPANATNATATNLTAFSSARCVLSPYCYDGVFNDTFVPVLGARYRAFAVNNVTVDAASTSSRAMQSAAVAGEKTVIVTALPYSPTTTTILTWVTQTTGTTTSTATTKSPQDIGWMVTTDDSTLSFNSDVDVPAAVILFVFTLIFTLLMLSYMFYQFCYTPDVLTGGRQVTADDSGGNLMMLKERTAPLILRSESPYSDAGNTPRRGLPYLGHTGGNTMSTATSFDDDVTIHRTTSTFVPPPSKQSAAFAQASPYRSGNGYQAQNTRPFTSTLHTPSISRSHSYRPDMAPGFANPPVLQAENSSRYNKPSVQMDLSPHHTDHFQASARHHSGGRENSVHHSFTNLPAPPQRAQGAPMIFNYSFGVNQI